MASVSVKSCSNKRALTDAVRLAKSVYAKKYRSLNRDRLVEYNRRWKAENREHILAYDEHYKDENREEILKRKRLRERKKRELIATRKRPYFCEVCGGPPKAGGSLHFDHDHLSGLFRGWLCGSCNLILGHAKDNPRILESLAAYLRKFGHE